MKHIFFLSAFTVWLGGCASIHVPSYDKMFSNKELNEKACYIVNSPETRSKGMAGSLLVAIFLGPLGAGLSTASQNDPKICDLKIKDAMNETVKIAYREDGKTWLKQLYLEYPAKITVDAVERDGDCINATIAVEKDSPKDSWSYSSQFRACKNDIGDIGYQADPGPR